MLKLLKMNEFKGTKGKWGYSPQKGNKTRGFQAQVWREDKFSLALIEPTENQEEATANARLIAHAPEMLEMLEQLIELHELGHEIGQYDKAKDLLTRATTI